VLRLARHPAREGRRSHDDERPLNIDFACASWREFGRDTGDATLPFA
jgi:hypothetical protein